MAHDADKEPEVDPEVDVVEPPPSGDGLPPIDFSTFLVSLSTSAMMHLGQGHDGSGESLPVNLPLAKQSIDLLALLEHKTHGNLTGDEERLLSQLLFDLRTRYVAMADQGS